LRDPRFRVVYGAFQQHAEVHQQPLDRRRCKQLGAVFRGTEQPIILLDHIDREFHPRYARVDLIFLEANISLHDFARGHIA
jgi:hypothetical protein